MDLEEYRRKRDFDRTPEPRGERAVIQDKEAAARYHGRYVVQKHDARTLHYDVRLEIEGVFKSWAVPRGPSFDPSDKRLAVHVEDHPLAYGDFEGVIPRDEYGAGPVQVWDRGMWTAEEDAVAAYRRGRLHVRLEGHKLHGSWHLVRSGVGDDGKDSWLLIKGDDEYAGTSDITTDDVSVLSGRRIEEIAAAPHRIWRPAAQTAVTDLPQRGRRAPMPEWLEPQLATLVDRPPAGAVWLNEIKLDGYRILCRIKKGKAQLLSRKGLDWTERFPTVAAAAAALPVREAWLDGEIAYVEVDGRTNFQSLQAALSRGDDIQLVYFVFDILYIDGMSLVDEPLLARKLSLASLLHDVAQGVLRYTDHIEGHGETFFHNACDFRLEGIIAKRKDRPRRTGRGRDWLKVKCLERQEFVVGGYTDPGGAHEGFGALLLGYYDAALNLVYAGRVGTGFTQEALADIYLRLRARPSKKPPFARGLPPGPQRGLHWVTPELVVEVAFSNWTREGLLRQPSFQGLRADKPAREVAREVVRPAPAMESAPSRPHAPVYVTRTKNALEIFGVHISNADRIVYPEQGITKGDVALYYAAVAERMLPQLVYRPLTLYRCPEGSAGDCFFQKRAGDMPSELTRVALREDDEEVEYLSADTPAAVLALVQMGVLEIHVWGSRRQRIEYPDRLVFDLDPDPAVPWQAVLAAAYEVRDRLQQLGFTSYPKTTGGKGLHLVVPVIPNQDWAEVYPVARAFAEDIARRAPRRFTARIAKASRRGKVYIDYVRNSRGATAIAEYSTRARAGAPVAVPVAWEELGPELRSDSFRLWSVIERVQSGLSPWPQYDSAACVIAPSVKRVLGLT